MNFEKLINNSLNDLGRATDMLWTCIGNPCTIEIQYPNGTIKKKDSTDYAIHFQCHWRFVKESKILLASHDIYNPYNDNLSYDDNWKWDVFGRDTNQSNVFDVRSKEFINEFLPLQIKNVYYTDTYDLHIDFDKDIHFDTFINTSTKREFYRFLDNVAGKHTMIFQDDECTE